MCTTLTFRSEVQLGHFGMEKFDSTVDDLMRKNDSRIIISCVAGTKMLKTMDQVSQAHLLDSCSTEAL
jgi:hypothetical protein